jgi:hypothetical protein
LRGSAEHRLLTRRRIYLGRVDNRVLGHGVELPEVEVVVRSLCGVDAVVALAFRRAAGTLFEWPAVQDDEIGEQDSSSGFYENSNRRHFFFRKLKSLIDSH